MADEYEIDRGDEGEGEVMPIDPQMVDSLAAVAIEKNPEAAEIKTLLKRDDMFRTLVINSEREGGPWMDFYVCTTEEEVARMKAVNPDVPTRIYVGSWPMTATLPNQN